MNQDSSTCLYALVDVAVCNSEKLLDVLFSIVFDVDAIVVKEVCSLGVLLAGDIQNMGNSSLQEASRLEP